MNRPETRTPGGDRANADESTDGPIVRASSPAAAASPDKRLATLMAKLARRGHAVHQTSDGFLVARWNMSRHVRDLEELEQFARQIGAV